MARGDRTGTASRGHRTSIARSPPTSHYARGVAHAALGEVDKAEEAEARVPGGEAHKVPETRLLHNNKVVDLLDIGAEMLRGEILYRKGEFEAAFAALRRSVALDDDLPYDEPWGWMQPTRHALGALLLEQGHDRSRPKRCSARISGLGGQLSRATVHPDNVWSLKGLHDCLESRDETNRRSCRSASASTSPTPVPTSLRRRLVLLRPGGAAGGGIANGHRVVRRAIALARIFAPLPARTYIDVSEETRRSVWRMAGHFPRAHDPVPDPARSSLETHHPHRRRANHRRQHRAVRVRRCMTPSRAPGCDRAVALGQDGVHHRAGT